MAELYFRYIEGEYTDSTSLREFRAGVLPEECGKLGWKVVQETTAVDSGVTEAMVKHIKIKIVQHARRVEVRKINFEKYVGRGATEAEVESMLDGLGYVRADAGDGYAEKLQKLLEILEERKQTHAPFSLKTASFHQDCGGWDDIDTEHYLIDETHLLTFNYHKVS